MYLYKEGGFNKFRKLNFNNSPPSSYRKKFIEINKNNEDSLNHQYSKNEKYPNNLLASVNYIIPSKFRLSSNINLSQLKNLKKNLFRDNSNRIIKDYGYISEKESEHYYKNKQNIDKREKENDISPSEYNGDTNIINLDDRKGSTQMMEKDKETNNIKRKKYNKKKKFNNNIHIYDKKEDILNKTNEIKVNIFKKEKNIYNKIKPKKRSLENREKINLNDVDENMLTYNNSEEIKFGHYKLLDKGINKKDYSCLKRNEQNCNDPTRKSIYTHKKINSKLNVIKKNNDNNNNNELKCENDKLKNEIIILKKKLEKIKNSSNLLSNEDCVFLYKEFLNLMEENETLKFKLENKNVNKPKKEKKYYEESKKSNEPKINKLKDTEEELVNYKDKEHDIFNENNMLNEQNNLNNNEDINNSNQHKESQDYNKLMNDLLDENNILKTENDNLNKLKEKYDKLNIDFNNLREENISINKEYYELKDKYKTLNNDYNKLKKEYNELENKYNTLMDDLNELKKNEKQKVKSMIKNDVLPYEKENIINLNNIIYFNYNFLPKYIYDKDSNIYINSFIQCLFHINELVTYFLYSYPNYSYELNKKNENVKSGGLISKSFYNLIKNCLQFGTENKRNINHNNLSTDEFIKILNICSPQLKNFNGNNFKDLIINLFQTMHEELNYYGDNILQNKNLVNEFDRFNMLNVFNNDFNNTNYSIISKLFYGTFEETIKYNCCESISYNYQKFESISFEVSNYKNKVFNIYNGFKDNEKPKLFNETNKINCKICSELNNAEYCCKIIQPPKILLINIDYSECGISKPSKIEFDEIIDITKYVNYDYRIPINYSIICVCNYINDSKNTDNFFTYYWNRQNEKWYKLNDSFLHECNKDDICSEKTILLIYEKL